jgi:hypothetical protein
VRKKREVLENISNAALLDRDINFACAIEQNTTGNRDRSQVRRNKARDAIEQGGLPRSRRTKQNGNAAFRGKLGVESETGSIFGYVDAKSACANSADGVPFYLHGPTIHIRRLIP